jgi:hypothetical protein
MVAHDRLRVIVMVTAMMGVAAAGAACSKTFHGAVAQPNPLISPTETLRDSEEIVIVTGDMELNVPREDESAGSASLMRMKRYPLQNVASFTVVSRDRLRFHVQLEHKWQDWANPSTWEVYLIDDQGHRWKPESTEHARTKHLVTMWDQEVRTVQRNGMGNIVAINDDGYKRRVPLGSLSVFRGKADFVFYERDIFTPDVRWVKLVVRRDGVGFEFRWDFQDGAAAADDVALR